MLCLRSISGLPLDVDMEMDRIMIDDLELDCSESRHVSLAEVVPGLLNKSLRYPECVYIQHHQVNRKQHAGFFSGKNLNYDVNYIPAVLLGIEYAKTQVYYQSCTKQTKIASFIEVLSGKLTVYLQKDTESDPYEFYASVEDAKLVEMKEGDKLAIPCNYMYTFINTGDLPVVYSRLFAQEHVMDSQKLLKHNGLAYYLISKNARREVVTNPRYRAVPELQEVNLAELNQQSNYAASATPMYDEVLQNATMHMQIA